MRNMRAFKNKINETEENLGPGTNEAQRRELDLEKKRRRGRSCRILGVQLR